MPDTTWRLAKRNARSESSDSDESDSDESPSSSDGDANVHFFGAGRVVAADEPRRVAKARRCTLDALLAALSILASSTDDQAGKTAPKIRDQRNARMHRLNAGVHEPWSSLEKALGELSSALGDKRVRDVREIMAGLDVLDHIITTRLMTLAQDKSYIRQRLSQSEAKSVRPFQRQVEKLRQDPSYPSAHEHAGRASCPSRLAHKQIAPFDALQAVPPALLCRIASYALSPPLRKGTHTLDLSRLLIFDVASTLDRLDSAELLHLFGVQASGVSRLSLARNKLARFPAWPRLPFADLVELDVSYNERIASLPLYFTRLDRLKRVVTTGTRLAVFDDARTQPSFVIPTLSPRTPERGADTLVHYTIRLLLQHISADPVDEQHSAKRSLALHLPPHLADKVLRGYTCELCHRITWPGRVEFADEEVELSLLVRAEEGEDAVLLPDGSPGKAVRLRGRACLSCCTNLSAT